MGQIDECMFYSVFLAIKTWILSCNLVQFIFHESVLKYKFNDLIQNLSLPKNHDVVNFSGLFNMNS